MERTPGVSICSQSPKGDAHTTESRVFWVRDSHWEMRWQSFANCSDLPPAFQSCLHLEARGIL